MKKTEKILNMTVKVLNTDYNRKSILHNALFLLVAALMIFACFRVGASVEGRVYETVEYDPENIIYASQYIKQFDAFAKGQLHLDIKADWKLAEMENPYDPAAREEEKVSYHWDHAYFEGKYYSYFGIAPLATVYLPVYLATGELPSDAYACMMLAVYAVIFLALAYREVVLRFCRKANLWLFLCGLCAFVSVSGVYLGVLCSDLYYIAVLSALASSMAFVFFAFRAMRERNIPLRAAMLTLAALTLTLTVLSRPTAAVMCVAVFPIFVEFLTKIRRETLKEGLVTVGAFALPLLLGAAFVMWYNAARFGSPFDFGSNYQLTVSDISENKVELELLFPALFSYFLYPFWKSAVKPHIKMGSQLVLPPDARYIYADNYAGAFAHGLPAAILLYPRVMALDKKEGRREHVKNAFAALVLALSVFIAFFDFCYAGVNMRYIYDILAMLSLVGSFTLLDLQGRAEKYGKIAMALVCLAFFAVAVWASIGTLGTFAVRF